VKEATGYASVRGRTRCECGNPATEMVSDGKICTRCADIESRRGAMRICGRGEFSAGEEYRVVLTSSIGTGVRELR